MSWLLAFLYGGCQTTADKPSSLQFSLFEYKQYYPISINFNRFISAMSSRVRFEEGVTQQLPETNAEEKESYSAEEFFNTVRFGIRVAIENMVSSSPHLVTIRDSKGNSCMHWAAKRGDVGILNYLREKGAPIDLPTLEEPNMLPIHWAAAEGQVDAIQFFLDHKQNINVQDGNACSVAVVAVQFNQLRSLVYLAKRGADLTIRDNSGDHCLHWAAYKGYDEILHVVLYFLPSELNSRDNFGQTALHLAAIKGHTEMVRSLIELYKADFSMQDKGGLTALDHSISKGNFMAEWVIRSLTAKSYISRMRAIIFERFKEKRFWMGILFGLGMKEQSVWLWRGTFFSNFFASIMTVYYAMHEKMGDLYILHITNTVMQVIWWICFLSCGLKEPGMVRETDIGGGSSSPTNKRLVYGDKVSGSDVIVPLTSDYDPASGIQLQNMGQKSSRSAYTHYDEGLDIMAKLKDGPKYKLCHTCRCARPLRSKHDKMINRCVHKFDHFCPFVDGSIGRDNYKFFVGLLIIHPIAYAGFVIATTYFFFRAPISVWYWMFLAYSAMMCLMLQGLLKYHLGLSMKNLTTNEDMGKQKYSYLYDEKQEFNNPFDAGTPFGNILDVIFPETKSFYSREEVIRDRYSGLR